VVSNATPTNGQVLAWDSGTNQWKPQNAASGGAAMAAQLGDFGVTQTASNALQAGGLCSTSTPCNVRMGAVTYSFIQASTITAGGGAAGTGTVFLYVSRTGVLTAGYTIPAGDTLTCGNCIAQASVATFPVDSLPLFSWSVTWSGGAPAFDAVGTDQRAVLSAGKNIVPGAGLVAVETAASTILALDPSVVGLKVAVPVSATSVCETGAWAADANYLYVCFQANSWRRAALTSW
jgi:hypothetical protein